LIESGRIDSQLGGYDFIKARNFVNKMQGSTISLSENSLYIPKETRTQLSDNEIHLIHHTLLDNMTDHPVGATTLAIMHTRKNTVDIVIEKQKRRYANDGEEELEYMKSNIPDNFFIFGLHALEGMETFKDWTVEDYFLVTKIGAEIKERQLEILIDIFERPEQYMQDGKMLRDIICGISREIDSKTDKKLPLDEGWEI